MHKGSIETDSDPRREPVTIVTNTLAHWPRQLGSLTPHDKECIAAAADRRLWAMFDGLFEILPLEPGGTGPFIGGVSVNAT